MAAVVPFVSFIRLDTGALYAQSVTGDVIRWRLERVGDAPCRIHLELDALTSPLGRLLVAATGGPNLDQAIIPLQGLFSQDGGASVDCRFVLTSCQRVLDPAGPMLVIDQEDGSALLGVTGVDRVTYINARPADVLDGLPGTIARPAGAIGALPAWPYVKGLDRVTVGLGSWKGQPGLQMSFVCDPSLAAGPLSADIYADTLANALKTISLRLAGVWHPKDTAPFGARGHWVAHTADAARNPLGIANCVAVGHVGAAPKCTFSGDRPVLWDETTVVGFASAGMSIEPLLGEMYAQAEMIGGISDHGIDNGQAASGGPATEILCGLVVLTGHGPGSTNWYDSLPILGTTAGVYYHVVGSGVLVPMSQDAVCNALAYVPATHDLYGAFNTGVYTAKDMPPPYTGATASGAAPTWARVGGLAAPVADVWRDPAGSILARCGGETKRNGQGIDGVYCYPALAGDTSGAKGGYAGWSRIAHSGAPLAAGGTVANLYYVDRNKPDTVYWLQPGTTNAPQTVTGIAAGQLVVGIDTGINVDGTANQLVYLRTDAGANGLYFVAIGTNQAIACGQGLVSNTGAVVQVRRITAYGASIDGEYVALFAATDAGLFVADFPTGPWRAPNAKSGLGDFDLDFACAGRPQTVLGRRMARLFAGAKRSFLVSCNNGDNWKELLAEKLDMGPAWYALARLAGAAPWPNNDVGAIGLAAGASGTVIGSNGSIFGGSAVSSQPLSPAGPLDTGGTGAILALPAGSPFALPTGFIDARRLDEQGQFTFRIVNTATQAPMAGIQFHELPELQSQADVGAITASGELRKVAFRWLWAASIPRFQVTIKASYTQSNAAARDLAFGDLVAVSYNPPGWSSVVALNTSLFVTSHVCEGGEGYVATTTTLSNSLEHSNLDANALAAAQADSLTKRLRFGSA